MEPKRRAKCPTCDRSFQAEEHGGFLPCLTCEEARSVRIIVPAGKFLYRREELPDGRLQWVKHGA